MRSRASSLKEEARLAGSAHLLVRVERLGPPCVVDAPRVRHEGARDGDPQPSRSEEQARCRCCVVILRSGKQRRAPHQHHSRHGSAGAALDIIDRVPRVSDAEVQHEPEEDGVVEVAFVQPAGARLVERRGGEGAQRRHHEHPHDGKRDARRSPRRHDAVLLRLGAGLELGPRVVERVEETRAYAERQEDRHDPWPRQRSSELDVAGQRSVAGEVDEAEGGRDAQ
mmetsp:Transcript_70050/g.169380  ORF Transcript_70050/g.169380 Transcript_70050/m.169380 type:complete len:225 (-) Transcript_70050:296-970(-)